MPVTGNITKMKNTDPRVDAYIAKKEDFAIKILDHLRKVIHKACPEITETIKWGFPHFEYEGPLCFMAGFKAHCTFGFWRGDLLKDLREKANTTGEKGMGQFGRITSLKDLPSDAAISKWIREAAKLNEQGVSALPPRKITTQKLLKTPAYFTKALSTNKKAEKNFHALTIAQRNEYIEWITEAKTESTRQSRMKSMLEWVRDAKPRNWKYMAKYK